MPKRDNQPSKKKTRIEKTMPIYKPAKACKWIEWDLENNIYKREWPDIKWASNNKTPFFNNDVINLLVDASNCYASLKNRRPDITASDIKTFFGILLLSGYRPFPRRRMYWELAKDVHCTVVSEFMS
nr:unnamed protein product [Callosobruchus chinensis]